MQVGSTTRVRLSQREVATLQYRLQRFEPGRWLGRDGFTCYQHSMATALYRFMPDLLVPVAEKMEKQKMYAEDLFFVAFLNRIYFSLIDFDQPPGFTYADLAKNDGWELPDEVVPRENMIRLGEIIDGIVARDGFLLGAKMYHGEAWVNDRDWFAIESKCFSTLRLWKTGSFRQWFNSLKQKDHFDLTYKILIYDMVFYNRGAFSLLPTRMAGRPELEHLLSQTPIDQILTLVEERDYPATLRAYGYE